LCAHYLSTIRPIGIGSKSRVAPFRPYLYTKEREQFRKTTEESIEKKASGAIGRLAKGVSVDTTVGTWQVAFRPVRASKASCLNCHAGANAGDMLGVMAYAVRKPVKPESDAAVQPVSLR